MHRKKKGGGALVYILDVGSDVVVYIRYTHCFHVAAHAQIKPSYLCMIGGVDLILSCCRPDQYYSIRTFSLINEVGTAISDDANANANVNCQCRYQ